MKYPNNGTKNPIIEQMQVIQNSQIPNNSSKFKFAQQSIFKNTFAKNQIVRNQDDSDSLQNIRQNPNRYKSLMWRYYTPYRSCTKAKCNVCGVDLMTTNKNTKGLHGHLKAKHVPYYEEFLKLSAASYDPLTQTKPIKKKKNKNSNPNKAKNQNDSQVKFSEKKQVHNSFYTENLEKNKRAPRYSNKEKLHKTYAQDQSNQEENSKNSQNTKGYQNKKTQRQSQKEDDFFPQEQQMSKIIFDEEDFELKQPPGISNSNLQTFPDRFQKHRPVNKNKQPNNKNSKNKIKGRQFFDDKEYINKTSINNKFENPWKYFDRPQVYQPCDVNTYGIEPAPKIINTGKFVPAVTIPKTKPIQNTNMDKQFWLFYLMFKDGLTMKDILNSAFYRKAFKSMGFQNFQKENKVNVLDIFNQFSFKSSQRNKNQILQLLQAQHKFTLGIDQFFLGNQRYLKILLLTRQKSFLIGVIKLDSQGQNDWVFNAIRTALVQYYINLQFHIFCILVSSVQINKLIAKQAETSKQIVICWQNIISDLIYQIFYNRKQKNILQQTIEQNCQLMISNQQDFFEQQDNIQFTLMKNNFNNSKNKIRNKQKGYLKQQYANILYKIYKMNLKQILNKQQIIKNKDIKSQQLKMFTQQSVVKALTSWQQLLKLCQALLQPNQSLSNINSYLELPLDQQDISLISELKFYLSRFDQTNQEFQLGQIDLLESDMAYRSLILQLMNRIPSQRNKPLKDKIITILAQKIFERRNKKLVSLMFYLQNPYTLDQNSEDAIFQMISRDQAKNLIMKFQGVLRYKDQPEFTENPFDDVPPSQPIDLGKKFKFNKKVKNSNKLKLQRQKLEHKESSASQQQNQPANLQIQPQDQENDKRLEINQDGQMQIQLPSGQSDFQIQILPDGDSHDSLTKRYMIRDDQRKKELQQKQKVQKSYISLARSLEVFDDDIKRQKLSKINKLQQHLKEDVPVIMKKQGQLQYVLDFLEKKIKSGKKVSPKLIHNLMISMLNIENQVGKWKLEQKELQN